MGGGKVSAPAAVLEPGSTEWQKLVTPSKVAPILGISPYTDQYSQWHRMAGHLERETVTDAMRRGTFHESAVLREFFYQHPELRHVPNSNKTVQVADWLAATPDALATVKALDNWQGPNDLILVEIKTADNWDEWGQKGTDEIPEHYRAQVIMCAHVVKADAIRVFVCGPYWEYREYVVDPDPELAEAILTRCRAFWESVQSGEEPELSSTLASFETWAKVADPTAGEGDAEISPELAVNYLAAHAAEKALPGYKAQIVNALQATGAKVAVCQGHKIAQRQRSSSGGATIAAARKRPTPDQIQIEETAA